MLHLDCGGDALRTFPCTHPLTPERGPTVSTLHAAPLSADQSGLQDLPQRERHLLALQFKPWIRTY